MQPDRAFDHALLTGAGGLGCSWRAGEAPAGYFVSTGDWAYLEIAVLPDAAGQWVPVWASDSPSTETVSIGGIDASTSAGETGWRLSAPVADSWIQLSITAAGLMTGDSRFDGLPEGTVSSRLAAVAESVFEAVGAATSEQLVWPHAELRQSDAACIGALDESGIVAAMNLSGADVEYTAVDPTSTPPTHFDEAVQSAARTFDCELRSDGILFATITTAWGLGAQFDAIMGSDGAPFFEEVELPDAPPASAGVITRHHDGPPSPGYLAVDTVLYEVTGDVSEELLQVIAAQSS